ncbi:PilZ domain-containing protein [Sphingomonas sp. KC8]|uniref:PilZ domain-containing protein n=1 Tax=Sphingomonas sp. KC8 TaxID=1030157 RepID=UPI000A31CC00|nr:PilZ domain-containing protein [Sphingomonas sp. KC8]ARS27097.1 hypothetical protein KC8_07310 [Sphingomonas sp. KC8]
MDDKTTLGIDDDGSAPVMHERKEPRDSLFLQAAVTLGEAGPLLLRVRNLSAGGMMVDCDQDCAKGDPVVAELRGIGRARGRIAWRASGRIGIAFDDPVDPLLARVPVKAAVRAQDMSTAMTEQMRRPGVRSKF